MTEYPFLLTLGFQTFKFWNNSSLKGAIAVTSLNSNGSVCLPQGSASQACKIEIAQSKTEKQWQGFAQSPDLFQDGTNNIHGKETSLP